MDITKPEQPKLAKHDASVLDLAFVMDCTGSMGSYIENARNSIRQIVEDIVASEKSDVKLALVEYRDHPPQETTFVTKTHDFTNSVKEMKSWLDECQAVGGGDAPEAVADGLHDALKLSWREKSTKICVLIADAPPHGLSKSGDNFPDGCPAGIDPVQIVNKMAEKGITLYSVGCEPALLPYKDFFTAIAYTTGGQYIPLRNANLLAKVIIGGAQEEISLEKLMEDVQEEVEQQLSACGGKVDEEVLNQAVHSKLQSRGVTTKNLKMNNQSIEAASEKAIKYSKMASLAELSAEFTPGPGGGYGAYAPHPIPMAMPHSSFMAAPGAYGAPPVMACEAYPAPPPPAAMFSASGGGADSYSVETDEINYGQSSRLVQKALQRRKK